MKKNKSRPLIKNSAGQDRCNSGGNPFGIPGVVYCKRNGSDAAIWRNTNARTCQSLLNEYQSDLKQAAAVTAYPVQPTVRVQTDSIYNEFSHQPQEYSQAFKMKIYSDLKSWFTSGRFFSKNCCV